MSKHPKTAKRTRRQATHVRVAKRQESTSAHVAKSASKILRSKTASKTEKSVAASALTQVSPSSQSMCRPAFAQDLHPSTFAYLKPTTEQLEAMEQLRQAAADYAAVVDALVPTGADKTYILRRHRETAMWVNVAVTRWADGEPRK